MDDITRTPWFSHEDAERAALMEALRQSNAALAEVCELLRRTQAEVAVIHAEASRLHAATMARHEALLRRLNREQP